MEWQKTQKHKSSKDIALSAIDCEETGNENRAITKKRTFSVVDIIYFAAAVFFIFAREESPDELLLMLLLLLRYYCYYDVDTSNFAT